MKRKKLVVGCIIGVVLVVLWIAFCGFQWSWGPFYALHDLKTSRYEGNAAEYSLENQQKKEQTVLEGKRIIFLGSSVTFGTASMGTSFADYLEKIDGVESIKEAVAGTTLVDNGPNSYISRLKRMKVEGDVDLLVCQLSTNDASQRKPLGEIAEGQDMEALDTKTVAGAIEYIIAYTKETYHCPVVFYISPKYSSKEYAALVTLLYEIQKKWDIDLIDMWNDEAFNDISEEARDLYMADSVHPTKAGYLQWWLPKFEEELSKIFE